MNRYLNTYDTYESRLQSLLDDGYDFMEASDIANDEELFNQEVFGENENIKINNKKMADDQRERKNCKNINGENTFILQLCFWVPMIIWIIVLFVFD